MKIGIVADTHIEEVDDDIPASVYEHFADVDLILHAGDIYIPAVLDRLARLAPVVAVSGNGDDNLGIQDPRLAENRVLTLDGLRLGLRHSIVFPESPPLYTLESEMKRCFGEPVDIIVVGDTHVASITTCKGVLVINPGSPTWPNNFKRRPGTIAILEIENGRPTASIVDLE